MIIFTAMSTGALPMDLTVTTSAEGDLLGCNTLLYQGSSLNGVIDLAHKTVNQTGNATTLGTSFKGHLSATGPIEISTLATVGSIKSTTGAITTSSDIGSLKTVFLQNSLQLTPGPLSLWKPGMSNVSSIHTQIGVSSSNYYGGRWTYYHQADGNAANELQWNVLGVNKTMGLTPSTLSFPQGLAVNSETVLPTISTAPTTVSYSADPTITNSLTFSSASTSHREITISFSLQVSATSSAGRLYLQVGNTSAWASQYEGFTQGNYSYTASASMNNYQTWTGLGVALMTASLPANALLVGSVRFYRLNTTSNRYVVWAQISCPDTGATMTGFAKSMWASGMGVVTLDVVQRARLVSSGVGFQVATTSVWNSLCA